MVIYATLNKLRTLFLLVKKIVTRASGETSVVKKGVPPLALVFGSVLSDIQNLSRAFPTDSVVKMGSPCPIFRFFMFYSSSSVTFQLNSEEVLFTLSERPEKRRGHR